LLLLLRKILIETRQRAWLTERIPDGHAARPDYSFLLQ